MRILHLSDEAVREIGPNDAGKVVASAEGLVWIDFDHTEESGMAMLADLFDVRAGDVADCLVRTPVLEGLQWHEVQPAVGASG